MLQETTNENVVRLAREWIGTPYLHQASAKGLGADCLGLVLGIFREVSADNLPSVPEYSSDWGEVSGREYLLQAASQYLLPVSQEQAPPGSVLIFRMKRGAVAKHLGVKSSIDTFIHAYEGIGVIESRLTEVWERKLAGVFQFPSNSKK